MALFEYQMDDIDIVQDFIRDYQDLYALIEKNILSLESDPTDANTLNELFRSVHTIKGNCGLLAITPLVNFLQQLETVLDMVRSDTIDFQAGLGDLVLLVMDRCTEFLNQLKTDLSVDYDEPLFQMVEEQIQQLTEVKADQRDAMLINALYLLDPKSWPEPTESSEHPGELLLKQYQIPSNADLLYILSLAEHSQSRAAFWHGRLERVLGYLMALNDYTGQPVEPVQLFIAACVHDISMSMLPASILLKREQLTEAESRLIQEHVWVASRLMSSFPNWREAKRIIDHHQEHYDGSGYPLGLKGTEICTGGQFLGIVHAFETIAYGYSKTVSRRRPFMRAVLELNRFSGVQFNPKWIEAFMEVTRAYEG
ncbi:MAG: HD domain-containing phosphohydrolase [Reinekea sp.]|jgi:response regulator RpfG family c-di-GMP phosphodiesterase